MKSTGDFARAARAGLAFSALLGVVLLVVQQGARLESAVKPATTSDRSAVPGPADDSKFHNDDRPISTSQPADSRTSSGTVNRSDAGKSHDDPLAANSPLVDLPDPSSLALEDRQEEISEWESKLEREDAIERLNAGRVTDSERREYGLIFERLVALKKVSLRENLDSVQTDLANLERSHKERLAAVGLRPAEMKPN